MFDISARGQLCLIEPDKLSARTVNLLNQGIDFDQIENTIVTESLAAESQADAEHFGHSTIDKDNKKIQSYGIEESSGR